MLAENQGESGASGLRSFLRALGPGLITGAADDDPSGIGTHSQIGAEFGYGLAWTFVLSFPLMVVIQEVAAEIGRVTGVGIARNLKRHYRAALWPMVFLAHCKHRQFGRGFERHGRGHGPADRR